MTFTAAELEEAIEGDENFEGWDEIEYAYEANPNFDQTKKDQADRLYNTWCNKRSNSWQPDDPDYQAYVAYREENRDVIDTIRRTDAKVVIHGVTYPIQVVENHGGEGLGSERFIVIEVDGRLFRKDGYYQSYVGSEWDGELREVRAVQKSVTFYE